MPTVRIWTSTSLIAASMLVTAQSFAQAPELRRTALSEDIERTITHINGDVYHAQTNRSGNRISRDARGDHSRGPAQP